jgi:hypothetical protein
MEKKSKILCGIFYVALGAILVMLLLSGCRTQKHIEYRDSIVTQYVTKIQHDTLISHIHDSVYYEVVKKGDTVFATKYVQKIAYKDRVVIKVDTLYKDKIVNKEKEITKEVTKVPTIYKYALFLCILFIVYIIYKIVRWIQAQKG